MATNTEVQVTWSASNSVSVASSGTQTSDAATVTTGTFQATALLKAAHSGTPASGDELEMVLTYTIGDPDGAGTDEFTTEQHSYTAILDTNLEDPAIALVELPAPILEVQIIANNTGASAITASATLLCQTV